MHWQLCSLQYIENNLFFPASTSQKETKSTEKDTKLVATTSNSKKGRGETSRPGSTEYGGLDGKDDRRPHSGSGRGGWRGRGRGERGRGRGERGRGGGGQGGDGGVRDEYRRKDGQRREYERDRYQTRDRNESRGGGRSKNQNDLGQNSKDSSHPKSKHDIPETNQKPDVIDNNRVKFVSNDSSGSQNKGSTKPPPGFKTPARPPPGFGIKADGQPPGLTSDR